VIFRTAGNTRVTRVLPAVRKITCSRDVSQHHTVCALWLICMLMRSSYLLPTFPLPYRCPFYRCRLYRQHQKMVAEFTVAEFSGCPIFRCPVYGCPVFHCPLYRCPVYRESFHAVGLSNQLSNLLCCPDRWWAECMQHDRSCIFWTNVRIIKIRAKQWHEMYSNCQSPISIGFPRWLLSVLAFRVPLEAHLPRLAAGCVGGRAGWPRQAA